MTFEMASARGLLGERRDGSVVSYADGVQRHFVASMATVDAAARQRQALLQEFLDYRRSALRGEHGGPREYLLPADRDPEAASEFAQRLLAHGIEVRRTRAATRACNVDLPAGSYLIASRQPAGRLLRTLLEDDSPMAEAFLAEQERRRQRGLGVELYDVLGWALPRLYNLPVATCDRRVGADAGPLTPADDYAPPLPPQAEVAYLVPWGTRAAGRFLTAALREGLLLNGAEAAMTLGGMDYDRGTLLIRVAAHPELGAEALHQRVEALARDSRAEVVAVDSSWTTAGTSFGSANFPRLHPPRIALAWDRPTGSLSAGHARFVLEQQFGYPLEVVRVADLGAPELQRFDVLILPDGGAYADVLGAAGVANLLAWTRRGGTLIGLGGAVDFLASDAVALLPARREQATDLADPDPAPPQPRVPALLLDDAEALRKAERPTEADPDPIPGVMLRAQPDPDHWLTVGLADSLPLMVQGNRVYQPLRRDEGSNVLTFAGPDELLLAGHLWQQNRAQWAHKPAVMATTAGAGVVVGFVVDPNFRGMADGLNVLFLNAVFRGPAQTQRLR